MLKEGMLCKHFKGKTLEEKNIYCIIKMHVDGDSIDQTQVRYSGDHELETAKDLVVYQNIFQENAYFAREYSDLVGELTPEKQQEYHQTYRVEPLTEEEIEIVSSDEFKMKKGLANEGNKRK